MSNYLLWVFSDWDGNEIPGINTVDGDDPTGGLPSSAFAEPMTAEECFSTRFNLDVHYVMYTVEDEQGRQLPQQPRINMPAQPSIDAAGYRLLTQWLVFDIDNPGHALWDSRAEEQVLSELFVERLTNAKVTPNYVHSTRAGMRLVYHLSRPISNVEQTEILHGMHNTLIEPICEEVGFVADKSCLKWNGLFRAPLVMRGGEPLEPAYLEAGPYSTTLYDPTRLPHQETTHSRTRKRVNSPTNPHPRQAPDPGESQEILDILRTSAVWTSVVSGCVTGKDHDWLFGGKRLTQVDHRDDTITRLAGTLCNRLRKEQLPDLGLYLKPKHLLAIMLPMLRRAEETEATGETFDHWYQKAWDRITEYWAEEEAQDPDLIPVPPRPSIEVPDPEDPGQQTPEGSVMDRVINGMKEWWPPIREAANRYQQEAIVRSMAYVITAEDCRYYALTPDGYYDTTAYRAGALMPLHFSNPLSAGEEPLIPRTKRTANNQIISVVKNDVDRYALPVAGENWYVPRKGAKLGAFVDPVTMEISCPAYWLRSQDPRPAVHLSPIRNETVDEWLDLTFGKRKLDFELWVGHAFSSLHKAAPLIAITGPPSVGKQMIVKALGNMINTKMVVDEHSVGGTDFNEDLMRTPVICINEGISPKQRNKILDDVRKWTSDSDAIVNRKMRTHVKFTSYKRVIFTTNDDHVLVDLVGSTNMNHHSREAILDRIMLVRARGAGAKFLEDGKGEEGITLGWVDDDILASHFAWLADTHAQRMESVGKAYHDTRFGIAQKGALRDEALIIALSTEVADTPLVLSSLIELFERQTTGKVVPQCANTFLVTSSGEIYLTTAGVRYFFNDSYNETFSDPRILAALTGVLSDRVENRRIGGQQKRCRLLDAQAVLTYAEATGQSCQNLRKVVEGDQTVVQLHPDQDEAASDGREQA